MQTRTLWRLTLAMDVMIVTGCAYRQPAMKEPCPPPAPAQPLIFYDETGEPSKMTPPLSELELLGLIDAVAAVTGDPIWLIRVKPASFVGEHCGAIAYVLPERQTSRIRTGYAYPISMWRDLTHVGFIWKYVQVSKQDGTFAQQFVLPSVGDLPFQQPEVIDPNTLSSAPMADEEIIRIVDFVRQPSSYESLPWMYGGIGAEPWKLPLRGISRRGDTIQVGFGYYHGFLWGYGWDITLERTPTDYRIVGCQMWMT